MPDWVKGILTGIISTGLSILAAVLLNLAFGEPLQTVAALLIGAGFGFLYGLEAGIVLSYDLGGVSAWLLLLLDFTWSLPNTVFGFVIGNLVYWFFGYPATALSQNQAWISFQPYGGGGFGHKVLQTLGTLNLGGAGQHERMHLLQARIFGPLYLSFFAVNYVVNGLVQILFMCPVGLILWATKVREKPYLRPPDTSAVGGFFGWIYYYTLFEIWAYGAGNP